MSDRNEYGEPERGSLTRAVWNELGLPEQIVYTTETRANDRQMIHVIAAELGRQHSFTERTVLVAELLAIYDRAVQAQPPSDED